MIRVNKNHLLLLLIVFPIFVDQLNGFLITKNINIAVSQCVKAVYLSVCLLFVIKRTRYIILYSLWFSGLGIALINASCLDDSPDIYKNIVFFTKLLTFPLTYYCISQLRLKIESFNNELGFKIPLVLLVTIFVAMSLSMLGFGMPMYGTVASASGKEIALGYRGYFIAGNELSVLFLLVYTFSLFYALSSKQFVFPMLLIAFIGLVTALLIATKTVLLAYCIVTIVLPLLDRVYKRIPVYIVTQKELHLSKVFLATCVFGIFLGLFVFSDSIKAKIDFITFNYNRSGDLITLLTSGRNERLDDSLTLFTKEYSTSEMLFGTGWEYPQKRLISAYQSDGSSEVDWLDLLVSIGIVGVSWIYVFWIVFLLRVYRAFKKQQHPYSVPLLLSASILFINSFISGHVLYSSLLGLYLGYLGGATVPTLSQQR